MGAERDFVVPADPSLRRRRTRSTVRVLLLDQRGWLLLQQDSDPGTGDRWWMTPGGGVDPGETDLDAVIRELAEETGLLVDAGQVVGPLARRHVVHGYSDQVTAQDEAFYAVRTETFEVDDAGWTEEERVTVLETRWWSPDSLATTTDEVWPHVLLDLLALLEEPTAWPRDLGSVEESSVPA